MISSNIYNNSQNLDNDVNVQVDNGNTKTKQIQATPNIRKLFKQKAKKFYLHRNYFTIRHSLYNNLISKSKSHLKFTVTLSFYVLFLGLIFRNYLVSPKLNHGFSGENTPFLKISYIYI